MDVVARAQSLSRASGAIATKDRTRGDRPTPRYHGFEQSGARARTPPRLPPRAQRVHVDPVEFAYDPRERTRAAFANCLYAASFFRGCISRDMTDGAGLSRRSQGRATIAWPETPTAMRARTRHSAAFAAGRAEGRRRRARGRGLFDEADAPIPPDDLPEALKSELRAHR